MVDLAVALVRQAFYLLGGAGGTKLLLQFRLALIIPLVHRSDETPVDNDGLKSRLIGGDRRKVDRTQVYACTEVRVDIGLSHDFLVHYFYHVKAYPGDNADLI